jgi:hypothetical protein
VIEADQGPVGHRAGNTTTSRDIAIWLDDEIFDGNGVEELHIGCSDDLGQKRGGNQGSMLHDHEIGLICDTSGLFFKQMTKTGAGFNLLDCWYLVFLFEDVFYIFLTFVRDGKFIEESMCRFADAHGREKLQAMGFDIIGLSSVMAFANECC